MQVKFIVGRDVTDLESELNDFLGSLDGEPRSIKYDIGNLSAVVEFDTVRKGAICCECRFWDDDGRHDKLIGLCQRCGGQKRFSDKACNKYEDIRG